MRFFGFLALMLALVMMIVSCGGDGEKNSTGQQKNSTVESSAEGTETPSDRESGSTDVDVDPDETPDGTSGDVLPTTPAESESEPSESNTTPEVSDTDSESSPTTPPETTPKTEAPTETTPVYTEPAPMQYTPRAMMYHLIRDDVYGIYDALFVRPSEFESHLILLNELGYEYIFADEWRLTDKPSVILTLDDGYLDNYTNMFPLLKKYGAKATVFIVTELIGTDGYMTREMIAEMAESGLVSFQCHTVNHVDLRYLSEEELRIRNRELERENAELREANNILKDALGFFAKDRKK